MLRKLFVLNLVLAVVPAWAKLPYQFQAPEGFVKDGKYNTHTWRNKRMSASVTIRATRHPKRLDPVKELGIEKYLAFMTRTHRSIHSGLGLVHNWNIKQHKVEQVPGGYRIEIVGDYSIGKKRKPAKFVEHLYYLGTSVFQVHYSYGRGSLKEGRRTLARFKAGGAR